ncbi:hypothetical protein GCM10010274_65810 [Streptomyces lavendofoliae]|uniref:Transposase n=1 Tax=Streptomyces lavendofoliae TaxID=67314 RepID=A0A918I4J0_9ACTN|nr:hypothetical protein GCM10010274_65810 [Streptomyces lavendofoliae]
MYRRAVLLLRRPGLKSSRPRRRARASREVRALRHSPLSATRGPRRPAADFDKVVCRDRKVVERCFARLKQVRAIATRFDKLADRYRAGVVLASLMLSLRVPTR